ncbi:MAG TPA: RDD family protein [Pseudolysinimonas sp.]|nr:RDD family protein [Pseudolysinimonas sp.]
MPVSDHDAGSEPGPGSGYDAYDPDALMTGEAVALDLRPTGWALRAAGTAIDFVVYLGAYLVIAIVLFNAAAASGSESAVFGILSVVALVGCLVVAPITVETASRGKSLGRLAVGARIVREDGGAIGFRHAAIRALVGVFEIFMTLGGIAAVAGLVTDRTRRIGDLLAGTYSQYERVSQVSAPVFGVPAPLADWALTADVARMPDGLSRRVAQFLAQAAQLTPDRRNYTAAQLAGEVAAYVSPLPPVPPELFLAGVAVVRREREFAALRLEQQRIARLEPALRGLPHGFPERG